MVDWTAWNTRYDDPGDWLVGRLRVVEEQLAAVLDRRPPGPLRLVSVCAGQGRDVLGVLTGHPRRNDVSALLVELDQATVDTGRELAAAAGLTRVRFAVGDAARTGLYREHVPADVVLVCGVFGNITDTDVHRTIGLLPGLCAPGASVIWTRGRHGTGADLVPAIRGWFAEAGFTEQDLHTSPAGFTVGRHELTGPAQPLVDGQVMFAFHGYDQLPRADTDAAASDAATADPAIHGR